MFEEAAPKRTGVFRNIFLIVIGGFILLALPDWIPALFDFPYVQGIYEFLVLLGICLLIFRFLRSYAMEYKYSVTDSVLTIRAKAGSREYEMVRIPLTKESKLIPFPEATELIREKKWNCRQITYGVANKNKAYLLTYPIQNGNSALIFQPSEKFVEILKQKLLDKSEKM